MGSQDENAPFGDVSGETLAHETNASRVFPGKQRGGSQVVTLVVSSIHALKAKFFDIRPRPRRDRFARSFVTFNHEYDTDDTAAREQQYAGTISNGTELLRLES
jgi:hypothetical protein